MSRLLLLVIAVVSACSYDSKPADTPIDAAGSGSGSGSGSGAGSDAGSDAPPPPAKKCSLATPWKAPINLTQLNSAPRTDSLGVNVDETEIYLSTVNGGTFDIYRATRGDRADLWGTPVLDPVLSVAGSDDGSPKLTDDGLTMVLAANSDIKISKRASLAAAWSAPQPIAEINSADVDYAPSINGDGTVIYFISGRSGASKLYRAQRATPTATFETPTVVDMPYDNLLFIPWVSKDELVMYTGRWNGTTCCGGGLDIYVASRASKDAAFSTPMKVSELAQGGGGGWVGWVSDDLCRLYMHSSRTGSLNNDLDVWYTSRDPD